MKDVLTYCAAKKIQATLRCESGSTEKALVIRQGNLVRAASNDPREYLGQFLINHGYITEEQLTQAFETQKQTQVRLGRILVMIGLVDETTIRNLLSLKLRETLLSLLDWKQGYFHLTKDQIPEIDPSVDIEIPLKEILEEHEFRSSTWEAIRNIFPSEDLYLEISPEDIPEEHDHPLDSRILDLAVQGQTIAEIALSLHTTPFVLYQRLLALHRAEILRPLSVDDFSREDSDIIPVAQIEEPTDIELDIVLDEAETIEKKQSSESPKTKQLLHLARDFLGQGKYTEAWGLAMKAIRLDPDDSGANAILKEAETGMLVALRHRFLERPMLPRLVTSRAPKDEKKLTPAERYLLKRFDGKKPLSAILRVSPIKEVEALQIVRDMVSKGVVALDPVK